MSGYFNLIGAGIDIFDEGVALVRGATSIDFVGSIVEGSAVGSAVTETFSGASANEIRNETPTGDVNGTNVTFVLANTPTSGKLQLYLNGVRQKLNSDFTLSTATITFVEAPQEDSVLLADYYY